MRAIITTLLLLIGLVPACGSVVDPADLDAIDDYESWERRVDAVGPVGGHGDSYRIMYANDIAETFRGSGLYAPGTVIVKEVRARDSGDMPGDISYVAIMRKLSEAPPGGTLDNGWLFTTTSEVGNSETNSARCWRTCHQAAPLDGTFLNWSASER